MKKCPTCVDQRTETRTETDVGPDDSGCLTVYYDREVEYTVDVPVVFSDEWSCCGRCGKELIPDPPVAPLAAKIPEAPTVPISFPKPTVSAAPTSNPPASAAAVSMRSAIFEPRISPKSSPLAPVRGRWGAKVLGGILAVALAIAGYSVFERDTPQASLVGSWKFVQNNVSQGVITFNSNGRYEMPSDNGPISGPYSLSSDTLVIEYPEVQFTAQILSETDSNTIRLRQTKRVDRGAGNVVSYPNDEWQLVRN